MKVAETPVDKAPAAPKNVAHGLILAGLGAIAFSGKAVIVKLAYRYGVDAVTLLMYRMLFALPIFLVMAWWAGRGQRRLSARDWRGVLGLGVSGYYLASFLDFAGLAYITAGLERLILYLNPTLVMLLGWLFFGERMNRRHIGAMLLSYGGVVLVFGVEAFGHGTRGAHTTWGVLLVLASAVCYAIYLLYSGEMVRRVGPLRLVGLATSVASVCCVVQFLVLRPLPAALVAPEVIWLSILNATACTAAPVLMVMLAIERIGAAMTAQTGMIGPLSTIVLAAWLLGEAITPTMIAGTVLVLAGITLFTRAGRRGSRA